MTARGGVHDLFFVKRVADAHDQSAIALTLGRLEIDDQTAVLHGDHFLNFDDAGFGVHFDLRHLHAANPAVGEVRRFAPVRIFAAYRERHGSDLGARFLPTE